MASRQSSGAAKKPTIANPICTAQDEEESERTLVSNLELRRQNATTRSGWDASVEGERPPLPRMPMSDRFLFAAQQPPTGTPALLNSMSKQFNIARKVKALSRSGKLALMRSVTEDHVEREPTSTATNDLFSSFRLQKNADGNSSSRTDIWVESAMKVNQMLENERGADSEEKDDNATSTESSSYLFEIDNSAEPLLPTTSMDSEPRVSSYGATGSGAGGKKQKKKGRKPIDTKKASQFWCLPRSHFGLAEIIHPAAFIQGLLRFLFASTFTFVTLPCVIVAALLFYYLGNPSLSFLPGNASLSWWLLFVARQALILELVIVIQYLAVEGIALRTKWMVYTCGPLVTLWFINAKGWPLIAILWSLLDLGLLHGEAPWQQNWLYYLHIPFFSSENSGGQIINSVFYLRILLSVLLAGCCHAIKRTHVALAFGRSTFLTYMAPLEQILGDIVLITEVAELATELQSFDAPNLLVSGRLHSLMKHNLDVNYQAKGANDFEKDSGDMNRSPTLHNVQFSDGDDSLDSLDDEGEADSVKESGDDDSEDDELSNEGDMGDNEDARKGDQVAFNSPQVPSGTFDPGSSTAESIFDGSKKSDRFTGATEASVRSTETTTSRLKQQLDRWQEPQNKLDKSIDVSIADILKFRKALTYMDDPFPFGFSFGPGATRNQVIRSSRKTYRRLLRSANLVNLSYDVIILLAVTEDGNIDEVKDRALKRLFRPDHHKQVTLLSFVQTCDTVYKKLRYFRASVGNASVINQVLESIVDSIVNFFLALVIMTILEYNPYPVLVSLSTVMVSLAFAVGSSASKYIEGVLLIAVRRPFDIGDRIMITPPAQGDSGGTSQSWFVEDINLWCTTLRYSATNEIAIVSNGILSTLRIVNCNRSPNAMFNFSLNFELDNVNNGKIDLFRQELEQYLRGHPRIYEGLVAFRCDSIDTKLKVAQYSIRIRHRRSWQDAIAILRNRGELIVFCIELGKELGINNVQVPIQVEAVTTEDTPETVADNSSDALAILAGSTTTATMSPSVHHRQI